MTFELILWRGTTRQELYLMTSEESVQPIGNIYMTVHVNK